MFDYDGTLCEPDARFDPLSPEIANGLNRLLQQGAIIGIATGRGGSAAERIQEAVSSEFAEMYWLVSITARSYNRFRTGHRLPPNPTVKFCAL